MLRATAAPQISQILNADGTPWEVTGTFSPTLIGLTTAGTNAYSNQEGRFVKRGNLD